MELFYTFVDCLENGYSEEGDYCDNKISTIGFHYGMFWSNIRCHLFRMDKNHPHINERGNFSEEHETILRKMFYEHAEQIYQEIINNSE